VKHFDVVTIFPEMLEALARHGITRRALEDGLFGLKTWDPRDFTTDAYRRVDDRPYGGGPGMVMKSEPLAAALAAAREAQRAEGVAATRTIHLSPAGERITHASVAALVAEAPARGYVLLASRYEGVDERLIAREIDVELSIGDFVLSGGELPALALIDAMVRLMPGVLNDAESAAQDSFADGLLDCGHYTRPEELWGERVPAVLLSGNHAEIRRWRRMQALGRTWQRRPDLIDAELLSAEDQALLEAYRREHGRR